MSAYPKPLLKWVGGKTKLLDAVLRKFPRTMRNYREPFVGGGSVLFAVLQNVARGDIVVEGAIFASDTNASLIAFYQNVQAHPIELAREIAQLSDQYASVAMQSKESLYYWIRAQYNTNSKDSLESSAQFLFLNKTCFRGLFREGPRGFNVPFGNYVNIEFASEETLVAASEILRPVVFAVSEFAPVLAEALPRDFVYMDPPYMPESITSFVKYTAAGFPLTQHMALFTLSRDMADRGIGWTMSNADVPEVRAAFINEKFSVEGIECRRAINSKNPAATAREVIISTLLPEEHTIVESMHPDA